MVQPFDFTLGSLTYDDRLWPATCAWPDDFWGIGAVWRGLVPYGEVWRLGANWATSLTLDVKGLPPGGRKASRRNHADHVRIGDLDVPRGLYTLFLLPSEDGAELIVNRQTRQWGTDYDPSLDLGRTSLRRRSLPETVQSLAVTLEPVFPQEAGRRPAGTMRITWGDVEFETDWRVIWP